MKLAQAQKVFCQQVLASLAPWQRQYCEELPRYKFLLLRGASRTGKSTLAKSLGKQPYIQTVQNAEVPDLKGFDRNTHSHIIFDNVNDMSFVLESRALFQANVDFHTLGESKTGMYSYKVWLWRIPLVVTIDDSAEWNSEEPWVKENMFEVKLTGRSWIEEV